MMICDPDNCPNCQYIGEGASWCDAIQEIVLDDWEPTEHFCSLDCPFLRKKSKEIQKKEKGEEGAMRNDFDTMVEKVMDCERLCEACMFEHEGCPGLTVGRSGEPSFPPCAEDLPAEGYIDPRLLKAVYDDIMEEELKHG